MKPFIFSFCCLLSAATAASGLAASPQNRAPAKSSLSLDALMERSNDVTVWRALKENFPDRVHLMEAETAEDLAEGRQDAALQKVQIRMMSFVIEQTPKLSKAPRASLLKFAGAKAAMLSAARQESVDMCAALVSGAAPAQWNTDAERTAAAAMMVSVIEGAKAAADQPTNFPRPTHADFSSLLDSLKAAGLPAEEADALTSQAMSQLPPSARCDLQVRVAQGAAALPDDIGTGVLPVVLGLGTG